MSLLYVHTKVAKGKTYYYFDTGQKNASGRPILSRLPDKRDPMFGRAYADAQSARKKRARVPDVRDFDWLIRAFEASPEFKSKAATTKKLYSRYLAHASAQFRNGSGRSWPLDIITSEQIIALRDKMQHTPGAANATMKAISAMMHWASSKGRKLLTKNVAKEVELLEMGEHAPWPLKLLDMALEDRAIRLPVAMLYYLGQRIGDTVLVGHGNLEGDIYVITQEKTGHTVRVPAHSHLQEIIAEDAAKGDTYLTNEWGKPVTESGIRQRIQKWAFGKGYRIVPHGLRKNAVNSLLEAGCTVAQVTAITGQDLKTVEHYAKHRNRDHLARAAIDKFEARTKEGRENNLRKPQELLS